MNFEIGLSGLRASQFAISTIAQNLANANTEGYHRRLVNFQSKANLGYENHFLGAGVDIHSVNRIRSQIIENSYSGAISDLQRIEQRLSIESQIESLFLPGQGSLQDVLTGVFNELASLSANPTEVVQRASVVRKGSELAQQISSVSGQLTNIKSNVATQIDLELDELNAQLRELVDLQAEIKVASVRAVPNELLDRRDQLINRIAEKIDIQRNENVQDGFGLTISGHSISIGKAPIQFETDLNEQGELEFQVAGSDQEVRFYSGRLNALQSLHNQTIDQFESRLDEFASGLIRNVDQVHAQGVGASGPYSILRGQRGVTDINQPLAQAETAFPIDNGELYFSITQPDGERRTLSIEIDPETESLRDLASKISGLPGVNALASAQTGRLSISAEPGFKFDFTGSLESVPDLGSFAGTGTPRIHGRYEGSDNTSLRVEIIGSGTVGVTPGLTARVFNASNEVVTELEIGESYEPGVPLDLIDGVQLSFDSGTVADGESFETALVANSDTTGALSALGINSFFSGSSANDIAVDNRLIENPNELATSVTGENGDTYNLARLVGLREQLVMNDNRLSFEDFLGEIVSEIGFQVQGSNKQYQTVSQLKTGLELEKDSISGVDLNEEMLHLANFQKSYEASVQVIRTMESMLDDLYRIIG